MWRGLRTRDSLSIILIALLGCQALVAGRVLRQSSGSTADQLLSDGSDTSTPASTGDQSPAAAPTTDTTAAQPPAQQIRLRWANQVDALPPAYQAAGAGVLNDILGPSGDQTVSDGQDDASPSIQPWYNSPSDTPAAAPSNGAAAEAVASPAVSQPTPSPTPVSTPTATPDPVQAPVVAVVPAVVVLAPAPAPEAEQALIPLLGGAVPVQAPDAAPAPAPAPTLNVACSDSGTDNQMGLTVCQFMTTLLPQNTRTRMCSRYLPRCPAPAAAPVGSAALAPAPAQTEVAVPAAGSSGSANSGNSGSANANAGSLLQPLLSGLESIFGGSQSGNGSNSGSGIAGLLG